MSPVSSLVAETQALATHQPCVVRPLEIPLHDPVIQANPRVFTPKACGLGGFQDWVPASSQCLDCQLGVEGSTQPFLCLEVAWRGKGMEVEG